MSEISGKNAKVMYGAIIIADMVTWAMSGFIETIIPVDTPFGETIKKYIAVKEGEPGTITFDGNYDPSDSTGQLALAAVCKAASGITNLYLYVNTNTYWKVGSGGEIIIRKCDAITMSRSGVGKITFEGQVSGASMEQVGTGA